VKSARVDLGQRSETVRRANLSAIVRTLHEDGPQSRSDLVARTGLTRSAIRALVGELTSAGLAIEDRAVHLGRPGRPSPEVSLVADAAVAVAFSIGVDSLSVATVGLGGIVLGLARSDRPRGHHAVDAVVGDLAALLDCLPAGRPAEEAVVAVGVAVPGIVRSRDGLVETAPNLGWTGVPLGALLRSRLDWSVPVVVRNEADLGVLAEHRRGAAVGIDDVIYVHGEVGVGGGLLLGGRPISGAAGYAGEIGHFPIAADGLPCRCGASGCWETVIGAGALLQRAGLARDAGAEGVDRVFAAARAGDPLALAAIEATGVQLGVGLGGFINTFNPRLVVLGGLFSRLHPYAQDAIWTSLAHHSMPAARALVRVAPAMLGVDAPLLGAAEVALEPVLADPASRFGTRDAVVELASA
jgi:predicted NBD/HSP70 family sugar kinase